MIIATFGPSTGWVGKTVRYDDGRFILEGFGEIDVSAVVDYDRQGHLIWAYAGLREWVYETAGLPAPAGSATLAAAAGQATPTVDQTGVTQPSVPQAASEAAPVAPPVAPQAQPVAPPVAPQAQPVAPQAQPVVPPAPSAAPEAYAAEAGPPVTPEAPAPPTPTPPTAAPPAEPRLWRLDARRVAAAGSSWGVSPLAR